jgi:ketosteroid isomerase-like protein
MNLIEQMIEDEFAAGNARDIEALLDLRTADAVEMFPGVPPLVGQDAIREAWSQESGITEQFTDRSIDDIKVAGEYAFVRFSFTHTVTPVASGKARAVVCQGMWVLHQQPNSSWKIHWEMVNSGEAVDLTKK